MYIAVLADNIADRKQTERLLGRANDVLVNETGTLYIDTYGDAESLYRAPMKYELFLIDISMDDDHGKSVVKHLKELNVPGTIIVLYDSDKFYDYWEALENNKPLEKPINVEKLHNIIREAHAVVEESNVPKIEIRTEQETYYIPLDQILYATSKDYTVYIHLVNGKTYSMLGEIRDFYIWVNTHKEFQYARKDLVANMDHVTNKTKRNITFENGDSFDLPIINHIPSNLY